MMQKGSAAFIWVIACSYHLQVECAILRSDVAQDFFLQVDQDESEPELAALQKAAIKLQNFCQAMQNETGVPRGATGIESDSIADPHCTQGVVSPDFKACCAKECGSCGTHKLCGDPGKYNEATGLLVDQCCYGRIMDNAPSCDKDHPPCKLPKSYKETLKKWVQDIPARHAMQDCNKAIPKARNSHNLAIDKGEWLAELYLKGETKYREAMKIAEDVYGKCDAKIREGELKTQKAEMKIAKANKADKVKNPMTGSSKLQKWEDDKYAGESESEFYAQIKKNAQKIIDEAKVGIENVKKLRQDAMKVKDVAPLQKRFDALVVDADGVYQEALRLWQQWIDSSKDYDCGAPPPVKNAESVCKDGNTKFSPTCSIKCKKGYDGNGTTNALFCARVGKFGEELSGEWTGMAACVGKMCGVPPHIKHAKTVLTSIRYPDASTYNCLEGFFTPGGNDGNHSFNVQCGTDGYFESNSSHVCNPVPCGTAPVLNGTKPVKGKFTYSQEANYTCLEGYTLDGLPGGRTYFHTSCQATGKFSHGNMGCQIIKCGPVPHFEHTKVSHLTTLDEDDQHYGDEAQYTCAEGYTLDQAVGGPTKFKLVCHLDGEFSLAGSVGNSQLHQPRCQPICVGMPPAVPHGVMLRREMCYGDTTMVIAEPGFSLDGNPIVGFSFFISVTSQGAFAGVESLYPVKCGKIPVVPKAKSSFGKDVAVYEDNVHYDCEKGYSIDGTNKAGSKSFSVSCGFDGWFSALPATGECINIDDCVGHSCGSHGTCVDHLMNYTCACDSGFGMTYHKKAKQLICGNIDDCGPEACGVGKCVDGVNSYSCNCPSGYKETTEIASGKAEHTCSPVICGVPEAVEFATILPEEATKEKASFGATLLYRCASGYTIDGAVQGKGKFEVKCQADKSFSKLDSCKAITCASAPEVENAAPSASSATFGESLEFQCATGYSLDGTASGDKTFEVSCLATGVFTSPQTCSIISCGMPPDTAHAHHAHVDVTYEGTSEYTCFSGYSTDGTKGGPEKFSVECKDDGNFTDLEQCTAKVCGELSPSDFDNANFRDEGEVRYPMATEITCLDGYTTDGTAGGNKTFTVSCLDSGNFEKFDKGTCKPVVCGKAPAAPNATVASGKGVMVFGDHVTYECLVGFTTGGEQEAPMTYDVECLANGGFSSPTPDMICRNVNDCEGHTCGPKGTCVDLIGPAPAYTCDCEYGYVIKVDKGTGEKHCGNKDDCKGVSCGVGVCKDLIGTYTCTCPGGYYVGTDDDGHKTCLPVMCFELTPEVERGTLVSTKGGAAHTGPVYFPTTLTYKCDKGYSSDGTPANARRQFQIQCKADGALHGLAECQPISCGTPPVLEHTKLLESDTSVDSVDYKEKAKYECDDGYTLKGKKGGGTTFEVECENNGHLTEAKVCEPVICGHAPEFPNSKAGIAHEMHFGQTAQYECVLGYTLDGTKGGLNEYSIDCLSNGSFTDMHTDTVCKPVSIEIPSIPHAKLVTYMGFNVGPEMPAPELAHYPNTVGYKCQEGFTVNGLSTGSKTFTSMVNWEGEWQPSLPDECHPITYKIRGLARDAPSADYLDGVEVSVKAPWTCHHYDQNQNDVWCAKAGTQNGYEYQYNGGKDPMNCGPCWCCKRQAGVHFDGRSSNGHFGIQGVPAGHITVSYTREGYISGERVIDLEHDINTGGAADISMSPVLAANAWRVVLQWGEKPPDLDTYGMWGPYKSCWYQRDQSDGSMSAHLEHDETQGFGPETLHLTGVGSCSGGPEYCDIKYSINDYTHAFANPSGAHIMPETDVEITLYNGDRIAGNWKIADCQETVYETGLWWHVFTIDGSTNELKWNCNQGPPPEGSEGAIGLLHHGSNNTQFLKPKH